MMRVMIGRHQVSTLCEFQPGFEETKDTRFVEVQFSASRSVIFGLDEASLLLQLVEVYASVHPFTCASPNSYLKRFNASFV